MKRSWYWSMQKTKKVNIVMRWPLHFSGKRKKKQRLLYGRKLLWRYLLQLFARIRANFIHSLTGLWSKPWSLRFRKYPVEGPLILPGVWHGLCSASWSQRGGPLATSTSRRWTEESASTHGGPCETCEMESIEIFSWNTKASDMREQKYSFKIWKAKQ